MPNDSAQIITSIDEHPTRRGRFVVSVDGAEIATVTTDDISELRIRVGEALPAITFAALQLRGRRTTVLDHALRLLAVRARATSELKKALMRSKDRPLADDVQWAISTLTERGYLDDARYADQFVRDRASSRGWAKHRMRQELRKRGVSQAHVEPALTQGDEDAAIDDERSATEAARKWRRTHAARDPVRDRQRLYGFLARRGFSPDVIRSAMRSALDNGDES